MVTSVQYPAVAELRDPQLDVVDDLGRDRLDQAREVGVRGLQVVDDLLQPPALLRREHARACDLERECRERARWPEHPVLAEQRLAEDERLAGVRGDLDLET